MMVRSPKLRGAFKTRGQAHVNEMKARNREPRSGPKASSRMPWPAPPAQRKKASTPKTTHSTRAPNRLLQALMKPRTRRAAHQTMPSSTNDPLAAGPVWDDDEVRAPIEPVMPKRALNLELSGVGVAAEHTRRQLRVNWWIPLYAALAVAGVVSGYGILIVAGVLLSLTAYRRPSEVLAAPTNRFESVKQDGERLMQAVVALDQVRVRIRPSPADGFVRAEIRAGLLSGASDVFDPARAEHRTLAYGIDTVRRRDGLGVLGGVDWPVGDSIVLQAPVWRDGVSLDDRVADWRDIAVALHQFSDPFAAWHAAIACAEQDRMGRVWAALAALEHTPGRSALRARLITWLGREGRWSGRAAVAVARGDVDAIDRCIASGPEHHQDSVATLMAARWSLAPDVDHLTRWAQDPVNAWALAEADLPPEADVRWQLLVEQDALDVVCAAVIALEDRTPTNTLTVLRAVLGRADLRERAEGGWASEGLVRATHAALRHLGLTGEPSDLVLLGRWTDSRAYGSTAREAHAALKELLGDIPLAGGLMMASATDAGGLTLADDADDAQSPERT